MPLYLVWRVRTVAAVMKLVLKCLKINYQRYFARIAQASPHHCSYPTGVSIFPVTESLSRYRFHSNFCHICYLNANQLLAVLSVFVVSGSKAVKVTNKS